MVSGYSSAVVARTYRATSVGTFSQIRSDDPVTRRILEQSQAADLLILNGLDPGGLGCIVGLATRREVDTGSPLLQRLAAHLSSAYRCRRRLRRYPPSAFIDSEAILSPDGRLLDARGPAASNAGRRLVEHAARAIATVRHRRQTNEPTQDWRPRFDGRWTLVDSRGDDGQPYVVARENQIALSTLSALTAREQQVVASALTGRSNKEIAYELGISYATVRVLLARAYRRLGVHTRKQLLQHPAIKALLGDALPETS